jgi:hypothetical protein
MSTNIIEYKIEVVSLLHGATSIWECGMPSEHALFLNLIISLKGRSNFSFY